jgi:2-amino-4-hydroxy-6-hydroxymethyldihydropteridine diphosphokinase
VAPAAVYIGLGSNLGDRFQALEKAVQNLKALDDSVLTAVSGIYETSPVGLESGLFLNTVAAIAADMGPRQLLAALMNMEQAMGRTRQEGSGDARIIDLDILLYGDTVIQDQDLILPHPRMLLRRFVMEPLAELAPAVQIPPSGISAHEAAERLAKEHPEQIIRRLGTLEEIRENLKSDV